jgi:hypothetical protein
MNKLVVIDTRYAYFGIEVNDKDIVVNTAPIARWMLNKNFNDIKKWVELKNHKIITIIDGE